MQKAINLPNLVRHIETLIDGLTTHFKRELELTIDDDQDFHRNMVRLNSLSKISTGLKLINEGVQGVSD